MFKVTKGLAQDIFSKVFNTRNKLNYNLRHTSHFDVPLLNPCTMELKGSHVGDPKFGIYYPMR